MPEYKTPKVILEHAREWLEDTNHWAVGVFETCIPMYAFESEEKIPEIPLLDFKSLTKKNEQCADCILGAVGRFSGKDDETDVLATPAGKAVEEAARRLYGKRVIDASVEALYKQRQSLKRRGRPLEGLPTGKVGIRREIEVKVAEGSHAFSFAISVNDNEKLFKSFKGNHKATLRILDRAIELAS